MTAYWRRSFERRRRKFQVELFDFIICP